jgi:hypothetical protein
MFTTCGRIPRKAPIDLSLRNKNKINLAIEKCLDMPLPLIFQG